MKSLSIASLVCVALATAAAAQSQEEGTGEESLRQLQALSDGFAAVAAQVTATTTGRPIRLFFNCESPSLRLLERENLVGNWEVAATRVRIGLATLR